MLRQRASCLLNSITTRVAAAPVSSVHFSSLSTPTNQSSYAGPRAPPHQPCVLARHQRHLSTTARSCIFRKLFNKQPSADDLRRADDLDSDHNLVFQASSTSYIKSCMGFIEATALIFAGAGALSVLGLISSPLVPGPETMVYISFYGFLSYGVLNLVRKYPSRIYFNEAEQKFVAVFIGYHPFSIRKVDIYPGDVVRKKETFMSLNVIPWAEDMCSIRGKQDILLVASNFSSPVYYNMLLGY